MQLTKKIGLLGPTNSGKTKFVKAFLNYINRKNIYQWNEEKEASSSKSIKPYTLNLHTGEKIILFDNPGEDALESLRMEVAKSNYSAFMIFIDSCGWNQGYIGFIQAKRIQKQLEIESFPLIFVLTKIDLYNSLVKKELIDLLARTMVSALKKVNDGDKVLFYSRSQQKAIWTKVDLKNNCISLSIIEQIFVNAIEKLSSKERPGALTGANVRNLVRSLLLGLYDLMRSWSVLPEYEKDLVQPLNFDLGRVLNFHRPTLLESGQDWQTYVKDKKIGEPIFPLDIFEYTRILDIFKRTCFAPLDKPELVETLEQLKEKYLPQCSIVETFTFQQSDYKLFPDMIKKLESIPALKEMKEKGMETDKKRSFTKVPPPPKPKPFKK